MLRASVTAVFRTRTPDEQHTYTHRALQVAGVVIEAAGEREILRQSKAVVPLPAPARRLSDPGGGGPAPSGRP